MSNPLYAGIDLGTTFFKVGLYNDCGERVGLGRRAFVKDVDSEGRCTVPVERFQATLSGALGDALAEAVRLPGEITGLSCCSQANTFLLLDKYDTPLTPLIVWSDQRAAPLGDAIAGMTSTEHFLERSGQGIMGAEGMLAKLDWLRHHEPDLWRHTARILTISDYLAMQMTGAFIGDSGTASLTGLWDIQKNAWNDEVIGFLDVARQKLPELYRPGSLTVGSGKSAAAWLGIPEKTPFTIGALDHHTAAIGGGIGVHAPISVSFGTSLVSFSFTDSYAPCENSCLGPATEDGKFYQIAFQAPGASVMDWYRETYAEGMPFAEMMLLAQRVQSGCDGLIAEIIGGRVEFQNQRALHGHGHHVRALMELTGRNTAMLLSCLPDQGDEGVGSIVAVGGAARRELWMRVIEEIAGVRVIPACPADTASKGTAMFAAVADGVARNLDECMHLWVGVPQRS